MSSFMVLLLLSGLIIRSRRERDPNIQGSLEFICLERFVRIEDAPSRGLIQGYWEPRL